MKKVSFLIRQGVVRFDASTLDEVQTIVKNDIVKNIDFVVEEVVTRDITKRVHLLMQDGLTMKEIRDKDHKENFNSQYVDNDWALPYTFDLLFDIKSEGEIANMLKVDGFLSDDLMDLCLTHGLTVEYLRGLEIG